MQRANDKTQIQQQLADMFNSVPHAVIRAICEANEWNVEKCIDSLLSSNNKDSGHKQGAVPKVNTIVRPVPFKHDSSNYANAIELMRTGHRVMVILRGAPGSGKSSLARDIVRKCVPNVRDEFLKEYIFSADDYFYDRHGRYIYDPNKLSEAHAANKTSVIKKAVAGTNPIIVDNTNMKIWEMIPYVQIALRHNYIFQLLEPNTPWKNTPSVLAKKNSHGVPNEKIRVMLRRYERITAAELIQMSKQADNSTLPTQSQNYTSVPAIQNVPKFVNDFKPIENPAYQNQSSHNILDIESNDSIQLDAPKAQRAGFAKRNTTHTQISNTDSDRADLPTTAWTPFEKESVNFWGINSEVNNNKGEQKSLLGLLKESVSEVSSSDMVVENELEPEESMFERHAVDCRNENEKFVSLRLIYPNKSVSGLWDLFVKCNGDIIWAIDILLKESELSRDSLLEDEPVLPDDYECDCNKSPPIEVAEVVETAIETSFNSKRRPKGRSAGPPNPRLKAEQQKVKELVENSFVLGEEHYNEHVRKIYNFRHGIVNNSKLISSSSQTDAVDEENDDNNEEDKEFVELDFDKNLLEQLNNIFRSEALDAGNDELPAKLLTNVFVPRNLAKDLYMLCMESMYNQIEEQRQQTLRDDENFAKLIRNLKYENYSEAPHNTQELLDFEMALNLLSTESKNDMRGQRVNDLASHLTLQKLSETFPGIPAETLSEILQANKNNYKDTLNVLHSATTGEEKSDAVPEPLPLKIESAAQKDSILAMKSTPTPEEAKRLGLAEFEKSRNAAVYHCQVKAECYQKAKDMIQSGNGAVAMYYSQVASYHKRQMDYYNQHAASAIMEVHKHTQNNPDLLDLHYLYVSEAIGSLDLFIDGHISSLRAVLRAYKHVFIITGRGLHSAGGVSTIKNKVKERLKERCLRWSEVNPGLLKVKIFSTSRFSK